MAEIINLRMARKAKLRADAAQNAAENRARFGRNKAEKARDTKSAERLQQQLDGVQLDGTAPDSPESGR